MNLNKLFIDTHSVDKITKIYHGKNSWCRCGCGGKYFSKGDKGFTRALNAILNNKFEVGTYEAIDTQSTYINIPEGEDYQNKCYCVYFD